MSNTVVTITKTGGGGVKFFNLVISCLDKMEKEGLVQASNNNEADAITVGEEVMELMVYLYEDDFKSFIVEASTRLKRKKKIGAN